MKLALAQIDTRVGDLPGNERRILAACDEARGLGASVVVLPELCVTGYPPRDLLFDDDLVAAAARATARIARETADLSVVLGTVEPGTTAPGGRPLRRNVAAVLRGGAVVASRAKVLLPTQDVFHEARWFEPGTTVEPADLGGGSAPAGLLVCEDLWDEDYPRHPAAELRAKGAGLLVCLSASPFRKGVARERLRRARRVGGPLVYVNAVGGEDELVFDGGSFVLGADGRVALALPRLEEAVAVVDLEALGGSRPEPSEEGACEIFAALVLGLRDFARKNGLASAVVGLSGGIDSAVVACLAREALGPERVFALALPSRFTDPRSTESARNLARALGVGFDVLDLEPVHEAAAAWLGPILEGGGTARENLQARLRMVALMAHVNRRGGLLLNTSNKVELALGYGTLHGDLAGGVAPLGDLLKNEVYALARLVNERRPGTIPAFVIERPPSAELAPDQVDPFDYDRVSPLVEALVRGVPGRRLVGAGADPAEVSRLERLLRAGEHKRRQGPIVLKVAPVSFGSGRLVPVTRAWPPLASR